jgi:hypothetical protein
MDEDVGMAPGDRIVVHTPDGRAYSGRLVEVRRRGRSPQAVVRLDTGWVTTYPLRMLVPISQEAPDRNGSGG